MELAPPLTAEDARKSLLATIRQLRGTSLGLDLRKVDDIRAMTNRVIEIRLTGPMPEFQCPAWGGAQVCSPLTAAGWIRRPQNTNGH